MVAVNHEILEWARIRAGLDKEDAAKKLRLSSSKRSTAIEKLETLEKGEKEPTRVQLNRISEVYRQPLLVFYLDKPPIDDTTAKDFRTLSSTIDPLADANMKLLLRNLQAAQIVLRDLLEDEDTVALEFVNSATIQTDIEYLAREIVTTLDFDLEKYRKRKPMREAFKYLRSCIESSGAFVLLMSNLGNYHTKIPVDVFRGMALADPIAPFIIINNQDAKVAWSFTALHEFTHLWLGSTGVSGTWGDMDIEQFCNRVAGHILLPHCELKQIANVAQAPFHFAVEDIGKFSEKRNISRAMVAYNLYQNQLIEFARWQDFRTHFQNEWNDQVVRERAQQKDRDIPIDPNAVRRSRLGQSLVNLVRRSVEAGDLSRTKASIALGVSPRRVDAVLYPRKPNRGM